MTQASKAPRTALMILEEALTMLRRGWCKGALARDGQGKPIALMDYRPDAEQWCASGAVLYAWRADPNRMQRLDGYDPIELARRYLLQVTNTEGTGRLARWNDKQERIFAEVETAFLMAIQLARDAEAGAP